MSNERSGIVWPIILIAVGVLFLAYNLGYIRYAELRELISTWWPLVLIALGIGGLLQRKR